MTASEYLQQHAAIKIGKDGQTELQRHLAVKEFERQHKALIWLVQIEDINSLGWVYCLAREQKLLLGIPWGAEFVTSVVSLK